MIHLLDIEGTVCSITFVKDVLYPYFLESYSLYLDKIEFPLTKDDEVSKILSQFDQAVTESRDTLTKHLQHLVDSDIKDPVLKAFQGLVWKRGYESGLLRAPLYPDAIRFIQSTEPIYIYSSGSIAAQKLLFSYVDVDGRLVDMTPRLLGYFDITTAGSKQETGSYEKIAAEIGKPITFYSDNIGEIRAAASAGLETRLVIRPGNAPLTAADKAGFRCMESFEV